MAESNEQFHHSRAIEVTLLRYLWGTRLFTDGVSDESARESAYLESLSNLHDLVSKVENDPRKADQIMRGVMPPRFDESNDMDVELWQAKLRLVPTRLITNGAIEIDREDVGIEFFDELLGWVVTYGENHGVQCATSSGCKHELPSHQEHCPVRITAVALSDEVRLTYFKLHGEYMVYSLVNRLQFVQNRIEEIGELFVKHGISSRDTAQAFLQGAEDEAITYGSQVNGLMPISE